MRAMSALAALLFGCSIVNDPSAHQGGAADAGADAGPWLVQANEFCQQFAALECYAHYNCCDTAGEPTEEALATCIQDASVACAMNALSRLLTDPRTGYDARVAGEVLLEGQRLGAACSPDVVEWFIERGGFQRALTGTVPGGDECTPRTTGITDFDFPALFSCEGSERACVAVTDRQWSCLARQDVGGDCVLYWDCQDGLRCVTGAFGGRGTCEERLPDGALCADGGECESLYCNTTCQQPSVQDIYCNIQNFWGTPAP